MRSIFVFLVFVSVSISGFSRDLNISIKNKQESLGVECDFVSYVSCVGSLVRVFEILNSQIWQSSIPRDVSNVKVDLGPGVFYISAPLTLKWRPKGGAKLEIVGSGKFGAEQPTVISGARKLTHVEPDSVNQKLLVIRVDKDIDIPKRNFPMGPHFDNSPAPTDLYLNDVYLKIASWPNSGYGTIDLAENALIRNDAFRIVERNVLDWKDEPDLTVMGYWFHDWSPEYYPARVRDGFLEFKTGKSKFGIKAGQRIRVVNAFSELDEPGEWYYSHDKSAFFVYPPNNTGLGESFEYEMALSERLLHIKDSDFVHVENISFEKSRGDGVMVVDSQQVVFSSVSIRHTGNRGIVIRGGRACGIENSLIENNGEGAVSLSGGNRITLTPSSHYITRSTIRNFSRVAKAYRYAISLAGVGQLAKINIISDGPHSAVYFAGNDHYIYGNEIFDVVKETSDSGAVYVGRDLTARGTVFSSNFIHDIKSGLKGGEVKGVYLDDEASGIFIENNIFLRVDQPVFVGGGRDNLIKGNIFIKSSPAIHLDARGLNWARSATLDPNGEIQKNLDAVPYKSSPYLELYPNLHNIRDDEIGAPKYNISSANVFVDSVPYRIYPEAKSGIDLNEGAGCIEFNDYFYLERVREYLNENFVGCHGKP